MGDPFLRHQGVMATATEWNDYPPELLVEADQRRAEAEQNMLNAPVLDPDPYNVSLTVLLSRWWNRKRHGN